MAKKEVVWTEIAQKQRRIILAYWNENNKSTVYSEKLIIEIRERIEIIRIHPNAGKKVDFPSTRVVSMGHFSIFRKQNLL
jgi:plasmid stabilization system protein ParE